ncbi:MAG: TonB-dependent receptor [Pseudomonadales bacterium]|nr:TonB-dependent receptor [Pseudomonadales bacterium]
MSRITMVGAMLCTANVYASDEDSELAALMALLDAETELATKSKMNADYVPGMVTVLHGDKLKSMGIQTSGEALGLVPGIYVSPGNTGQVVSVVRGVGVTLGSSNLKIMLNGVAMNSAVTGAADSVLRLPIFQIERIEVIRGPGSSLYGEFAYSGVVNIITRKNTNAAHVKMGDNNYRQMDAMLGSEKSEDGINWQLNMSSWETDGTGRESGLDNFAGAGGNGYAPGSIFDQEEGQLLFFASSYQGYEFKGHYIDTERGGYFGNLAKGEKDYDPGHETIINVELSKKWQISDNINSGLSVAYQQTDFEHAKNLALPAGVNQPGPGPKIPNTHDQIRQTGFEDSYFKINAFMDWQTSASNTVLVMLESVKYEVKDSYGTATDLGIEMTLPENALEVINTAQRQINSLVLQDQWRIVDNIELPAGIRFDDYDDLGSNSSPRLAGVWRITDNHILKAQYAEAFRPPTLAQSYPGPETNLARFTPQAIVPEELSSYELSYIYRQPIRNFKATLFQTEVTDLIEFYIKPGSPPIFRNLGEIKSTGLELEWQETLSDNWQLMSNVSYVDAEDKRDVDEEFTGAVNWLANLGLSWNATPNMMHTLLYKYVGEQEGAELPNLKLPHVETFAAYNTLDYSVSYGNAFGARGLLLQLSIKNLTDETWESQAYPTQWPEGLTQGGRNWLLGCEYEF